MFLIAVMIEGLPGKQTKERERESRKPEPNSAVSPDGEMKYNV